MKEDISDSFEKARLSQMLRASLLTNQLDVIEKAFEEKESEDKEIEKSFTSTTDIEKSYLSQILNASRITGDEEAIQKAFSNIIEKGKKANIGETRTWAGGKFRKTQSGWEPVKNEGKVTPVEKEEKSDYKDMSVEQLEKIKSDLFAAILENGGHKPNEGNLKMLGDKTAEVQKEINKKQGSVKEVEEKKEEKSTNSLEDREGFKKTAFGWIIPEKLLSEVKEILREESITEENKNELAKLFKVDKNDLSISYKRNLHGGSIHQVISYKDDVLAIGNTFIV